MLWEKRAVPKRITSPAGEEGHTISHVKTGAQAAQALCATFLDKPWKHEGSMFQRGS